MALILITRPPQNQFFSIENIKFILSVILGRNRGPRGVTQSVIRGLKQLNIPFQLDPSMDTIKPGDTIWVNESLKALIYILNNKPPQTMLLAGPNLVITPLDHNEIICNPAIDIIIEPSLWVKNFITSLKPELEERTVIWPSGVEIPKKIPTSKTIDAIIYVKNFEEPELLKDIQKNLILQGKTFKIVIYGKFNQQKYFDLLEKSKSLIYVGKSESQGLALQEAWARDVPTLVLQQSTFIYKTYSFQDPTISAPYLSKESGLFFTKDRLSETMQHFFEILPSFSPRNYVISNLSDTECAKKFLAISHKKFDILKK